MADYQALQALMLEAALAAGEIILEVYRRPFDVSHKQDNSPVTEADEKAEAVILDILRETDIPVLAEEEVAAGRIPEIGDRFFVVDPLDGTKEFIKRNGEFTVNIALVESGQPVLGVVTAPALNTGYIGGPDGAFRFEVINGLAAARNRIEALPQPPYKVVASRSHGHAALGPLLDELEIAEDISVGSSLKFCLLAEGRAQFYPRFTPTCEWDTAAGHAVLNAAGGCVLTLDGEDLCYGKTGTNFLNPYFMAAANAEKGRNAAAIMNKLVEADKTH